MTDRVDEDRQLFDLDRHRSHARQQLLQCRGAIAAKSKAKRRAQLCLAEIDTLPQSINAYKAVGRAFLLTPINRIKGDLGTLIERNDGEVATLQSQEKHLVTELNNYENSIEEIVGKENKSQQ